MKQPPRIHVLIAQNGVSALVLRRGPSNHVASISWSLQTDEFKLGQWFSGRIYERRSDLSPDGRSFLYFASNGAWEQGLKRESFTAISRVPYLTPVDLWPHAEGFWNGGGVFVEPATCWLNLEIIEASRRRSRIEVYSDSENVKKYGAGDASVYFARLERAGWMLIEDSLKDLTRVTRKPRQVIFERRLEANWVLRKECRLGNEAVDAHSLVHEASGTVLAMPGWEWAEWDAPRRRILWAEKGCIFAANFENGNYGAPQKLSDFNSMKFEQLKCPAVFRK